MTTIYRTYLYWVARVVAAVLIVGLIVTLLPTNKVSATTFDVVLVSGTSWTVPAGVTSVKVWAIGAGGGGAGSPAVDASSGGGGGGGEVVVTTFSVTGGNSITYSLGTAGTGGIGGANGQAGGNTSATYSATTITAHGGGAGQYNSNVAGTGGTGGGGTAGGTGAGATGDEGGGGGGGIGTANGASPTSAGGAGAQGADVSGLQTAVTNAGTTWSGVGAGSPCCNDTSGDTNHGGNAAGFGSGGGGAGYYGGNGGSGHYGGGGGGAAGYTASEAGGSGGQGVVVLEYSISPAGTPGTPGFSSVTATTTALSWTASSPAADSYNLEVCSSSVSCSLFTGISSNATTTYNLVGNTSYDYAVMGVSTNGNSAWSATSTQLTLPNQAGTPSLSGATATTTLVSWTAPTGGTSTYKLQWCTGASCSLSTGLAGLSTTTNLAGNTTYTFAVRGTNTAGDGIYSATSSSLLTLPDTPGAVSLSSIAAKSVTINWSAPAGGTGTYTLQYCTGGSCVLSSGLSVTSTSSNPLVANTTYGFQVRGVNATGSGFYSATTTQLTLPDVAGTPSYGSTSYNSTTVSWSAPAGGTSTYKLERCTNAGVCTLISGLSGTSYVDSGLSAITAYNYAVLGTNATGDGAFSATSTVTTLAVPNTSIYTRINGLRLNGGVRIK